MPAEVTTFLRDKFGPARVYLGDPECVDTAAMYESFVRDLWEGVSGGALRLERFASVEGPVRKITIAMPETDALTFEAEGDTDWADLAAVVRATNALLAQRRDPRQLVEFRDRDFGQESGFLLATREELVALLEYGLETNRTVSLTLGEGVRLEPASEDLEGDPEPWERLWGELAQ